MNIDSMDDLKGKAVRFANGDLATARLRSDEPTGVTVTFERQNGGLKGTKWIGGFEKTPDGKLALPDSIVSIEDFSG